MGKKHSGWVSTSLLVLVLLASSVETLHAEFSEEQRAELLRTLSPYFISDGPDGRPPVNPSFFAENCRIFDVSSEKWLTAPSGQIGWKAEELLKWLQLGDHSPQSARWKISAEEWRLQGTVKSGRDRCRRSTEVAIREGNGVFGHVAHLEADCYSVKYFLFLAWNETAFFGGEGNHEGDWLCLDLQVTADDPTKPHIDYAFYHNHGRVLLVEPDALYLRDGRPVAYMEKGSNELWPNRGGRGLGGHPPSGVLATKYWPSGEGENSEYMVVREHRGQGLVYDTLGKVCNLEVCRDLNCRLVLEYRGEWGERRVNRFQWLSGVKVTSPPSPRWNAKMWDRDFTTCTNDPRADTIWLDPPSQSRK